MSRTAIVVLVALAGAVSATACSLLLDTTREQCNSDADCTARGGVFAGSMCVANACVAAGAPDAASPFDAGVFTPDADAGSDADPAWGCLGNRPRPAPTSKTAKYGVRMYDFIDQTKPLMSLRLRVCPDPVDVVCASPAATATADPDGYMRADLDISAGPFKGFMAIDPILPDGGSALVDAAPDSGANDQVYLPSYVYFEGAPLYGDLVDDFYMVVTFSMLGTLTAAYGLGEPQRDLGILFLQAWDCSTAFGLDVTFELDAVMSQTRIFYFQGSFPLSTATATDATGTGGVLNAPVGARVVTARLASTGQETGRTTIFSLPGKMIWANIGPPFTGP